MRKLNEFFCIIEKEKIYLEERNLNQYLFNGIYFKAPDLPPVIIVEKSIVNDRCKYISILAEELGHHFTSLGNLTIESKNYSEKLMKNKQEHKAKSWAANFLISDDEFLQALCNCISTPCEICDFFNITNEMLQYKIHSIVVDENRYNHIRSALKRKEVPYNSCEI